MFKPLVSSVASHSNLGCGIKARPILVGRDFSVLHRAQGATGNSWQAAAAWFAVAVL